jgi:putative peptidoglycan lipid II flippase
MSIKKKQSLTQGSFLFSIGTLLSRLAGLLRESVVAGVFGANLLLDAFFVANRIPNVLRELLAEGALGSSFTKVFSSVWEEDPKRAHKLVWDSLWFFSILSFFICFLGFYFAEELVLLFTFSRSHNDGLFFKETVTLTRILFPFMGLMTIGSIASGVLHHRGRFFFSAVSPMLLNLGYLIGALIFPSFLFYLAHFFPSLNNLSSDLAIIGLALGVFLGGISQTAMQLGGIWKTFIKGKWSRFTLSSDLKKVLTLMGPMILGSGAGQINVLVNTNFAALLGEGAVSWLTFSFRLLQLPIGLFGVAIGTVALPSLTKSIKVYGMISQEVGSKLGEALKLVCLLMLPCFCFLYVNHKPIVELLYQHGQFDSKAAKGTAECLFAYSFSIIAYGSIKVLTAFYYAADKAKIAMLWGVFSIALNYFLNSVLATDSQGLALSASLVLNLNAGFLLLGLMYQKIWISYKKVLIFLAQMLPISILAIWIPSYLSQWILDQNLSLGLKTEALLVLTLNGFILLSLYGPFIWKIFKSR